jgi:hypothetical protein
MKFGLFKYSVKCLIMEVWVSKLYCTLGNQVAILTTFHVEYEIGNVYNV